MFLQQPFFNSFPFELPVFIHSNQPFPQQCAKHKKKINYARVRYTSLSIIIHDIIFFSRLFLFKNKKRLINAIIFKYHHLKILLVQNYIDAK